MKCVVTGGCGFAGPPLVEGLVVLGREVVAVDNRSTSDVAHLNNRASLVEGSITDPALLVSATQSAEQVFHSAAWARVARSVEDPVGTQRVKVTGALNVFRPARINVV